MPSWTKARSEYANLAKNHQITEPEMVAKRAELRALKLEDHVRRILAEAPPLTDEQRTKLAELLRPVRRPAPARDRKSAVAERITELDGGAA